MTRTNKENGCTIDKKVYIRMGNKMYDLLVEEAKRLKVTRTKYITLAIKLALLNDEMESIVLDEHKKMAQEYIEAMIPTIGVRYKKITDSDFDENCREETTNTLSNKKKEPSNSKEDDLIF